ncbi:MAG: transglutaminase domain-containing protein [bacterium]|nr:transglutaminase domain-containing protein [bacterium]
MEQQTREPLPNDVTPKDVWHGFETFEHKALQGFQTEAESLSSYRELLSGLQSYFGQDKVLRSPAPPDKEIVARLFYRHGDTALLPVQFMQDTGGRVVKEVLDGKPSYSGRRFWGNEVGLIRHALRGELQRVSSDLNQEVSDRRKLEALAGKGAEALPPEKKSGSTEITVRRIRESALEILRQNPDISADIRQVESYVPILKSVEDSLSTQPAPAGVEVEARLDPYSDLLKKADGSSWTTEISQRVDLGQLPAVQKILNNLVEEAEAPDFLWRTWVGKGIIPAQLLDSFEEIMLLAELSETAKKLSGLPREVKAEHLLPYLHRGTSAGLLLDIAQSRYTFPDNFLKNQVDVFIHFGDVQEDSKKTKLTVKQRLVRAALVGMITASAFIHDERVASFPEIESFDSENEIAQDTPGSAEPQQPSGTSEGVGSQEALEPDAGRPLGQAGFQRGEGETVKTETGGVIEGEQGAQRGGSGERPGGEVSQGKGLGLARTFGATPADMTDQTRAIEGGQGAQPEPVSSSVDSIKPKNDSPEAVEEAKKIIWWRLAGRELDGFYRTLTSTYFNPRTKEWSVWSLPTSPVFTDRVDISTSGEIRIGSERVRLPVKGDYAPTREGLKVEGEVVQPGIFQATDGTYALYFRKEDVGKMVRISFDVGKVTGSIPAPDSQELLMMNTKLLDIGLLPNDVRVFMQYLIGRLDVSVIDKAKNIERYIQQSFQYSLEPELSDYYHQAGDSQEFFRRIAQVKKVDCDVANTMLVALLRSAGIPSRMVFGFANTGGFLDSDETTLRGSEGHGWIEAYIGNNWVSLDATPADMTAQTKAAVGGEQGAQDTSGRAESQQPPGASGGVGPRGPLKPDAGQPLGQEGGVETGKTEAGGAIEGGQGAKQGGDGIGGREKAQQASSGERLGGGVSQGEGLGSAETFGGTPADMTARGTVGGKQGVPQSSNVGEGGGPQEASRPISERHPASRGEGLDLAKTLESIGAFLDENVLADLAWKLALANTALAASTVLLRRKNEKLADDLAGKVNARTSRYWGESVVGELLRVQEKQEIPNVPRGANKVRLIPPLGLFAPLDDLVNAVRLSRIPYRKGDEVTPPAEGPNEFDFLTRALGYDKERIKRELLEDAYTATVHALWVQRDTVLRYLSRTPDLHQVAWSVHKRLEKLRQPSGEQWEEMKGKLTDAAWARYQRVLKRRGLKTEEALVSKEQFGVLLDPLFRNQLVSWQVRQAHNQALRSISVPAEP